MDYILDDIVFEMRYCDRLERFERISKYYYVMKDLACSKSEIDNSNYALLKIFLEKEIDWEKRIYVKLKNGRRDIRRVCRECGCICKRSSIYRKRADFMTVPDWVMRIQRQKTENRIEKMRILCSCFQRSMQERT